jgi:hypothetical protein
MYEIGFREKDTPTLDSLGPEIRNVTTSLSTSRSSRDPKTQALNSEAKTLNPTP